MSMKFGLRIDVDLQMYQNSLRMMPTVLNTDIILSVPKCNWCTEHNDCSNRTQHDQERF